jgi:hypothetical protein
VNNLEKAIESELRNGLKWNLSQNFGGDFGKLDYVALSYSWIEWRLLLLGI